MQPLPVLNRFMSQNELCWHIRDELTRCHIPIIDCFPSAELKVSIGGQLGKLLFERLPQWWVVQGPVPLELARHMYKDPLGKADISAAQMSTPKNPDELDDLGHVEVRDGRKCIMSYRINSEIGLRFFADCIRTHCDRGTSGRAN